MTEKKKAAWADCCEDWGSYMAAKKSKLQDQFQEIAKNEFSNATKIFNGVAIFVNGYTNPSSEELKHIMMAHGGIYHHYLRSNGTTHMIASNLPYSKIVAYKKAQNPLPLCKPEWIVDSVKAGKLLDYRHYLLYSQSIKNQASIFSLISKQNKPEPTSTSSNSKISNCTENFESNAISVANNTQSLVSKHTETSTTVSNCSKNPEFIAEFYHNSRLHHIATMGAMFKDYINDLRDKSNEKFLGLEALKKIAYEKLCKPGPSNKANDSDSDDDFFNNSSTNENIPSLAEKKQIIMHIDMDCFFVSVGIRNHPELKGFPIAVAHAKGNKQSTSNDSNDCGSMSEIASCSYEARKAGIKNGMFLGQALKLCPELKTIRYNFEEYKEVACTLYDTVASYTLDIEAVSCDEMYANCTRICQSTGLNPLEFATVLRNEIKNKTGCPVSTGFGDNKLQARLATKKAKPDGQCYLSGQDMKYFVRTLNVRDLPGVGYSTSHKLQQMNVQTCADLEKISVYELQKEFGKKNGQQLYDMCRGIDHSKLNLEHVRKSISAEVNYGIRFQNTDAAHEFLKKLSDEISDRLKKVNLKGKCITLKVLFRAKEAPKEPTKFMGHGLCDSYNKSKNLVAPTDDPAIIAREVILLWNQLNENPEDARGIGIQITKLESLKSKDTKFSLLKFIDKMQGPKYKNSESNSLNTNRSESKLVNNYNLRDDDVNFIKANEISLNLDQVISDKILNDSDSPENNEIISPKVKPLQEPEYNLQKKEIIDEINIPVVNQSFKSSSQLKQKVQSQYFKQKKPFSENIRGKVKMPDIQDIDMKVLIELPEDIRNEILNEYKQNKDNEISEETRINEINNDTVKNKTTFNQNFEKTLSFSQIDPEILAALPDDVQNEVKSYYNAQKRQKNHTEQAKETKSSKNMANRGWDMFKSEKKLPKTSKVKSGKTKAVKKTVKKESKTKISPPLNKNIKSVDNKIGNNSAIPNENNPQVKPVAESSNVNKSIYFDSSKGNAEHTEMLSNLVNCLLDLPISQVKLQIREWIINSSDINDVDFLSLTTYLGVLPRKHRLVDLHILLKCLHRTVTNTKSCIWHQTYEKMLKHVQSRMLEQYGHQLMIANKIECNKCY